MHTKRGILGVILLSTFALTACGTTKQLSFEEAKELLISNDTLLSQAFLGATAPSQADFSLTTSFQNGEDMSADIRLTTQSQQEPVTKTSQTQLAFDTDILFLGTLLGISGDIDIFTTPAQLFLKVQDLGVTSTESDIEMLSLIVQGIKGQRLKMTLPEEELLKGVDDYRSMVITLQSKIKDLLVNQGNAPYQGTFSQFTDMPAYQFTLDQEKLNFLSQEFTSIINTFNQQSLALDATLGGENAENLEAPVLTGIDIKIPVFEGSLVLLGEKEVAVVVDTFEITIQEVTLGGEYRYGPEGMVMHIRDKETAEDILQITILQTKKGTYQVDIQLADIFSLTGTVSITPKKSDLSITFDLLFSVNETLTTLADSTLTGVSVSTKLVEIPLKGAWKYQLLPSLTLTEPTEAIDILELLGVMMGSEGEGEEIIEEESGI